MKEKQWEYPERLLEKFGRVKIEGEAYKQLIERVFQRDKWMCRNPFCQAVRQLTPHHLRKRAQLGGDEMGNLITVCISCHNLIEANKLRIEVVDVVVKFHR